MSLCEHMLLFLMGKCLGTQLLSQISRCLTSFKNARLFTTVLASFLHAPCPRKYGSLNCSTCLSTLGIVSLLNFSHCQEEKLEISALRMLINRIMSVHKLFTPFKKSFRKSNEKNSNSMNELEVLFLSLQLNNSRKIILFPVLQNLFIFLQRIYNLL